MATTTQQCPFLQKYDEIESRLCQIDDILTMDFSNKRILCELQIKYRSILFDWKLIISMYDEYKKSIDIKTLEEKKQEYRDLFVNETYDTIHEQLADLYNKLSNNCNKTILKTCMWCHGQYNFSENNIVCSNCHRHLTKHIEKKQSQSKENTQKDYRPQLQLEHKSISV